MTRNIYDKNDMRNINKNGNKNKNKNKNDDGDDNDNENENENEMAVADCLKRKREEQFHQSRNDAEMVANFLKSSLDSKYAIERNL